MSTTGIVWSKGGRCIGLTTLPLSYVDFLEIWELQPPGTLGGCPVLCGESLTQYVSIATWGMNFSKPNDSIIWILFLTGTGILLIVTFWLVLVFDQPPIQSVKPSLPRCSAKHVNVPTNFHCVLRLKMYGAMLLSPPTRIVTMWGINTGTNLFIETDEKVAVQHIPVYIQNFKKGVYFSGICIIVLKYRGETILKTRYSTFFLLCFQCALLLTVVGLVCIVVTSCVLLYCVCITILDTLVAGLLARIQYPEGPATGHLGTGFSWCPCVYKRMLRWFPRLQVATACFSCRPPDLNFLVT